MSLIIRTCTVLDIAIIVKLSAEKRLAYEKIQPQFWRSAEKADQKQAEWFQKLLTDDNFIMLCAEEDTVIQGFVIGQIITAPAVYNPGGLTIMVDDFCVASTLYWQHIGSALINNLKIQASLRNFVQVVMVCGAHDMLKKQFIESTGLSITSEWYCGQI